MSAGRRRGGPARVADGVGAGQPTRDATGAARRGADEAPRAEPRGEARASPCRRTASARPPPSQRHASVMVDRPPANIPGGDRQRGDGDDAETGLERVRGEAPRAAGCSLTDGRDRRHAGRAPGGQDAGHERDERAHDDQRAMIVRGAITVARLRQLDAERPRQRDHALARGRCRTASPITEASRPITRPSLRSPSASTWRREPPSVRSVANSRVRWATVIESVLKITNAPTSSDKPARSRAGSTSAPTCLVPVELGPASAFACLCGILDLPGPLGTQRLHGPHRAGSRSCSPSWPRSRSSRSRLRAASASARSSGPRPRCLAKPSESTSP